MSIQNKIYQSRIRLNEVDTGPSAIVPTEPSTSPTPTDDEQQWGDSSKYCVEIRWHLHGYKSRLKGMKKRLAEWNARCTYANLFAECHEHCWWKGPRWDLDHNEIIECMFDCLTDNSSNCEEHRQFYEDAIANYEAKIADLLDMMEHFGCNELFGIEPESKPTKPTKPTDGSGIKALPKIPKDGGIGDIV